MYQRKSDGKWAEKIALGNGKYKVIYGNTKAEVKKKLLEYTASEEKTLAFRKAADAWEAAHAEEVSYNAHNVYLAPLRRTKEYFADTPMAEITPDQINAFIQHIAKQGYAKRTVQIYRNMLNMIFDHTITRPNSPIKINPCLSVKVPKGLPQKRRLPPTDEQLLIIETPSDNEMWLFAHFLLYTGLRRGELLGLKWGDIDRDAKTITVRRTVYYEGNNPHTKLPKTEAGCRVIDLLQPLEAALPENGDGYIFGGDKPLTKTQFRKRWVSFCREVGLAEAVQNIHVASNGREYVSVDWKPLITPHQFRHAYASMLDDAGIDEFTAKNLLGHSSIIVTKDIYTHLRAQKKARAGDTLNAYLAEQNK